MRWSGWSRRPRRWPRCRLLQTGDWPAVENLHVAARLQQVRARGGQAEVPAALLRHSRLIHDSCLCFKRTVFLLMPSYAPCSAGRLHQRCTLLKNLGIQMLFPDISVEKFVSCFTGEFYPLCQVTSSSFTDIEGTLFYFFNNVCAIFFVQLSPISVI